MHEEVKELCLGIARRIREKVLEKSKNPLELDKNVGIGADGTPTKQIDKLAEDIAIECLRHSKIPVNLLSEEIGFLDFGGEYTIILDPIDGTKNAVRGIPFYAVSVAVGKRSLKDVEFGVVINIPSGDIFRAEKGKGSFLNGKAIVTPHSTREKPLCSIVPCREFERRGNLLLRHSHIRSLGAASLEISYVASGAIDCFICLKEHLRITDIAAAVLILKEAGGAICNGSGEEIEMPLDVTKRTSVIAATSRSTLEKVFSLLS